MSFYSSINHASKVALAIYKLLATSVMGYYLIRGVIRDEQRRK